MRGADTRVKVHHREPPVAFAEPRQVVDAVELHGLGLRVAPAAGGARSSRRAVHAGAHVQRRCVPVPRRDLDRDLASLVREAADE
eukprot:5443198-Prymnesium_polylepis.2